MIQILKIILIILEVLAIFNLMIIVHELGHFLAARWRGLVIEKFGIWFGKPLWKKTINGVEYSLGSIPAGGFVALPQLAPMEVMEGKVETPRDQLPPISVLDKIIVAFAGPLFSFLLAVVFAIIIWQCGRPVSEPESSTTVGYIQEKSPAAEAQMQVGDKILSVDGHPVTRFQGMSTDSIAWSVVRSEGEKVSIVVERDVDGKKETKELWVAPTIPEKTHWWNRKNLRTIGILPSYSFVVGKVQPGSAAARAGLHIDDVITAINGQKMNVPEDLYEYGKTHLTGPYELTIERPEVELAKGERVRWSDNLKLTKFTVPFEPKGVLIAGVENESPAGAAGLQKGDVVLSVDNQPTNFREQMIDYVGSRAGVPIAFHILRAGQELSIKVTPQVPIGLPPEMEKHGKIGAILESTDGLAYENMGKSRLIYPHPAEQVHQSVMAIVNTLNAVLSRKSSIGVQQMGGPVMMMNAYYHMLSSPEGIRMAIWFSVVLNVNLALLNMLPIPVLDGGHITLAIIEAVRRKPMNVRILEYVQTTCALAIIGFMLFIMFFDVQDLPFMGDKRPSLRFQKVSEEAAK